MSFDTISVCTKFEVNTIKKVKHGNFLEFFQNVSNK